jgi:hypothetical protein
MRITVNVSTPRAIAETLVSAVIYKLEMENIKLIDYSIEFDNSMSNRYGWKVKGETNGEFNIATAIDVEKSAWPMAIHPESVCGYFLVQMNDYIVFGNKPVCNDRNINWGD